MTVKFITPEDEKHWLSMKGKVITSTEVSALFGLNPWVTEFELYQKHKNGVVVDFKTNERIEKGKRIEQYAAEETGLELGFSVRPFKDFALDEERKIGASFDWIAETENGPAILEMKASDYFQFKEKFTEDEMPPQYEIQVMFQMLVSGIKKSYVSVWTGIYDFHIYEREYDTEFGAALEKRVTKFWRDVEAGNEPAVDYERDAAVIAAMFPNLRPDPVDMTDDADFENLLTRYELAAMQEGEFKKQKEAIKAEIHHKLRDAPLAYTERYKVTAGMTKGTPDRVAEPGEVIKGRKGYRQMLVKRVTPKE